MFKMRFQASLDLQKTLKSSENDKNVCVFGCLCVFFTCVYGENAIHANIKNTYTPTFRGVKIDPDLRFFHFKRKFTFNL